VRGCVKWGKVKTGKANPHRAKGITKYGNNVCISSCEAYQIFKQPFGEQGKYVLLSLTPTVLGLGTSAS